MANTKISALSSGTPAQSTDLVPIARSGANYSLPLSGLFTGIGSAVCLADGLAGADWGAKVQAADTQLGATAGEIWITQAAGTSAPAANITLNTNHVLRFLQGGTWSLGTKSILIPAGSLGGSVIGSPGFENTQLLYTGTGFAIVAGSAGATLTQGILLQDLYINCQSTSANAGCIQLLCTLFANVVRCTLKCSTSQPQYGIVSDGTGNFSAYTTVQQCSINLAQVGIKFTGGSNSNAVIGGAVVGNSAPVNSIGIDVDAGDSCNVLSCDVESYAAGIVFNASYTLMNCVRFESNTLDILFTNVSSYNSIWTIDKLSALNVSNLGTNNQIFSPDVPLLTTKNTFPNVVATASEIGASSVDGTYITLYTVPSGSAGIYRVSGSIVARTESSSAWSVGAGVEFPSGTHIGGADYAGEVNMETGAQSVYNNIFTMPPLYLHVGDGIGYGSQTVSGSNTGGAFDAVWVVERLG